MMSFWIETKVRYNKVMEDGALKSVTETNIVNALSFTEAEARIIEEITPYISGDFTVSAVKKTNISEIFYDEKGDRWYKVKVLFITLDEKSGVEKQTANYMLVQASDFHNALENFIDGMKSTMADFKITSISETNIMDVFEEKLTQE
ncbi:DUF4494 domain-containing protein [Phocaeicola dorei]|uniref:DUF4494 domain-containing protein n=1 Tax=Phocaeicola dorei TaxID=357276 RepID=UPI001BDE6C4E|nr:DUF4494 domain-containing protein [Phocaeicola dorei]MBT1285861.1 DUF4494 domain-containing protein [Phocaeicola dorei]MBT1289729.1 DUF4494 domain-containing protein [Phocaeicola dorei]